MANCAAQAPRAHHFDGERTMGRFRGIRRRLLLTGLGAIVALGIAAPAASASLGWSQTSHDFGSQTVGATAPAKTLTLTATCDGQSIPPICSTPAAGVHFFGAPTVTGEGFALALPNTCLAGVLVTPTFPSSAPCSTTVTFTPTSAGAKSGSLNLPSGPDVALTGTGVAPPVVCKKGQKLKNGKCVKKKKKRKKKK